MNIEPILREALVTPDDLPGWSPVGSVPGRESSPFAKTVYADRFIGEATVRLAKDETGEMLMEHVGLLPATEVAQLHKDLVSAIVTPDGEMLRDGAGEAWVVSPLTLHPLGDQSISFRLIASLPDAGLLLADNVYMRRGRVAAALVRMAGAGAPAGRARIEPLAELAERKLASAAEKIAAG